jgi:hypothetical protein
MGVLNDLAKEAAGQASGPCDKQVSFGEKLMLAVSELAKVSEAGRGGRHSPGRGYLAEFGDAGLAERSATMRCLFERHVEGTVEDGLAGAFIRLLEIAGCGGVDLDWHVRAKMAYDRGCNRGAGAGLPAIAGEDVERVLGGG